MFQIDNSSSCIIQKKLINVQVYIIQLTNFRQPQIQEIQLSTTVCALRDFIWCVITSVKDNIATIL